MTTFIKSMNTEEKVPHSPPPGRSFQGVKATVGADSFLMAHNRLARANMPVDNASYRPFEGVKATIDDGNFVYNQYKKNKAANEGKKRAELKPHVGADAMMFDFAKRQQQSSPVSVRNQFTPAGSNSRPHVTSDSFVANAVRKAHTSSADTGRSWQGQKANVGADSFHMSFINSMRSWTKPKQSGHEIRL